MRNFLINKEMDRRATAVMTGEEGCAESVTEVVISFASKSKELDNDDLVVRFNNADDCQTAMRCMRDAKADVKRLDALTMVIYP